MSKDPIALAISLMESSLATKRAEIDQIESAISALRGKAKPKKQLALPSPDHFKEAEPAKQRPRRQSEQKKERPGSDYAFIVNDVEILMTARQHTLMTMLNDEPEGSFVTWDRILPIFNDDKIAAANAITLLRPKLKEASATIGRYRGYGVRLENIEADQ